MSTARRLAGALLCGVVACGAVVADAAAQDEAAGARVGVPVEVRIDRTLVAPGTPLAGASVVFVEPGEGPAEAASRAVVTDSAGRCISDGPMAGGTLLVWAGGRAPVAVYARGALSGPLILAPALQLSVRVSKPTGAPLADAYVEVDVRLPVTGAPLDGATHHTYTLTAHTDGDGAAQFAGLPDVNLRVRASAEGFVGPELFPVRATDVPLALALHAGARISGRAVVIPGGGPAVGTMVSAGGRSAPVRADGSYQLDAVRPGEVEVVAESPDLLQREPVRLVLAEGERRASINLELMRTCVLSGQVLSADGTPVEVADLSLLWPASQALWSQMQRQVERAVTPESDGRFRLTDLPPAEGVALEIRAPGHAPVLIEGLSLVAGEQTGPLHVEMHAGALLAGRVVDTGGAAASGARVEARPVGDAVDRVPADVAITGPGGVFLLDALPPLPVRLRVVPAPGSVWRSSEHGPFTPGEHEASNTGALVLHEGHALRGRVEGAPRDAVARIEDAAGALYDVPLEDGVFAVDGLPAGEALVEVASADVEGGARALVRLPSGWPLALIWRPAAPVILRVRGPGKRPVTSAELTFEPRGNADPSAVPEIPPPRWSIHAGDVDGVYSVALEPGLWRVTVRAGDLIGALSLDVAQGSGTVATLDLARGENVRGFVTSADGTVPVEGARVTVAPFGDPGQPTLSTITDARGLFEVAGVQPGIVRVTVDASGHALWSSVPVAVRTAETADLGQLDLIRGGAVTGVLHDAYGTPSRGAIVALHHEDATTRETTTDLHGRFRFESIAPGAMTLRTAGVQRRVVLALGAREVAVVIELGAGVELKGRVTSDGRAEPFAGITAWTLDELAVEVAVHTDGEGRFRLPPLPPGEIEVEVLAAGAEVPHRLFLRLPDAPEEWVDVELPVGGIAGEVLDAKGVGVPGARLWLWALGEDGYPVEVVARVGAGPNGRFVIERVESGRYEIEARRDGHGQGWSAQLDVRAGVLAFGVVVKLTGEAILSADIVDERALPVVGGWLSAMPYVDGPLRVRTRVRAAADGRAVLRSLAPGAYEVTVGGPGRGRVELGIVQVLEGPNDVGRVMLDPGGALRITALHPGYIPAPRQRVLVEDLLGRDPRPEDGARASGFGRGATAADGSLLVGDLAPGFYRVWLADDDPETAYLVQVRSGEVTLISLWAPWPDGD